MKIGYFTTFYPYAESFIGSGQYNIYPIGGADLLSYYLANNMAQLGHEVMVFTTSRDSRTYIEETKNLKVFRYGTDLKIQKAFFSRGLQFMPLSQNLDIVHIHYTTPPGTLAGYYYAELKKKPLVVSYHGDADPTYGNALRRIGTTLFNSIFVDRMLSKARFIISPSEFYINESKFLSKHRNKIAVIPIGVKSEDIEAPYTKEECRKRLNLPINKKIILFLGILIDYKNPDLLVRALPRVLEKVPDAMAIFVGDGRMRPSLVQLADNLGLSEKVYFAGAIYGKEKSLYYGAADAFVLPSKLKTEVFPQTLLEASVAALPIIVSDILTFRCIIEDGYNGMTVKAGDIESLAQGIIRVMTDDLFQLKISKNAREKVKMYSWEAMAESTNRLYLTLDLKK